MTAAACLSPSRAPSSCPAHHAEVGVGCRDRSAQGTRGPAPPAEAHALARTRKTLLGSEEDSDAASGHEVRIQGWSDDLGFLEEGSG